MKKYYIAALNSVDYIGLASIKKLINFFGTAQNVWNAKIEEIAQVGIPDIALQSFQKFRSDNPDTPEKLAQYCTEKNIGLCCIFDAGYPEILKQIPNPPAVLYHYGNIQPSALRIAVIGTRNNTDYGKRLATEISSQLASYEVTVVSGAARGIDTLAHTAALQNGRTVAVVGYGIDFIFSAPNSNLLREIAQYGAVISAFNPFQAPSKITFPQRNRIIAGLSLGVVAVEASEKSGTEITCRYAIDYGRKLFAVPGNIDSPQSVGCNRLIQNGAILIRNATDIFKSFNPTLKNFCKT